MLCQASGIFLNVVNICLLFLYHLYSYFYIIYLENKFKIPKDFLFSPFEPNLFVIFRRRYCRHFKFSLSSPEPIWQSQPNLLQSIFGSKGFKFIQRKDNIRSFITGFKATKTTLTTFSFFRWPILTKHSTDHLNIYFLNEGFFPRKKKETSENTLRIFEHWHETYLGEGKLRKYI